MPMKTKNLALEKKIDLSCSYHFNFENVKAFHLYIVEAVCMISERPLSQLKVTRSNCSHTNKSCSSLALRSLWLFMGAFALNDFTQWALLVSPVPQDITVILDLEEI